MTPDHAAHCGPTRGQYRVCYCSSLCCRQLVDGRVTSVCTGCRALPECAGHQKGEGS